ncbi:hypothetical protein C5167_025090 [Papaver somniferum]|uniref:Ribosomal protein L30 ferredoxin-like fold domain-containing protein n=1 Tax=Papaver somniferum TaxID=3469 RepID=A0A4Y7JRK7_PAPSO|nr:60S ribosomal protein L7-2-like [Papaver somniferum]RZC63357.1 hypothetical protein C5167_025090 [Papaver somniferum]
MAEVEEAPKALNYIPEIVLKKRKSSDDWAIRRREQAELKKERTKKNKSLVFRRAEDFIKEYRNKELDFVQMKHRKKQRTSSNAIPESKLLFVIRIRGTNDMHFQTRKALHSLKLRSINSGVFVKANEGVMDILKRIEPYVTYGSPNFQTVKDLICKKGYGKIDKQKTPLTDNNLIEQALGQYGILCIEDIVHEIANVGSHFREVVNFLWPFKLTRPEGGKLLKKTRFSDGGDAGNRADNINELINKMN